jgi:hypothetical protein
LTTVVVVLSLLLRALIVGLVSVGVILVSSTLLYDTGEAVVVPATFASCFTNIFNIYGKDERKDGAHGS